MDTVHPASLTGIESKFRGLTTQEAKNRQKKYGLNIVITARSTTLFFSFLSKFANPLILILLAASFISALTKNAQDFIIITSIIVLSVVIDFYQERQSTQAVEKLKQRVVVKATVLRDGEKREIHTSQITVGDIVFLLAGDVVPADIQLLSIKDLHIDESTLTGESFPAEKHISDTILMGTTVVNGEAIGKVILTGKDTQFGKIAEKLSLKKPDTDFTIGIRQFSVLILRFTLALVIVIFFVNTVLKHDIFESLLFSLALAIGLTPELLPMIITVNLAKGAIRMAKKGVIVKHLPSIQNFGSMNVLCTDKTGTLTMNKIKLEIYENIAQKEDKRVLEFAYLNSSFQSNLKSPLDEAVLAHTEAATPGFEKIDEIPFDFIRKRLSVILKQKHTTTLICKGAADEIWPITKMYADNDKILPFTKDVEERVKKRFEELSSDGFRVLAVAFREMKERKKIYEKGDEKDLVFLGFTAFFDPPKHEAKEVLQALQKEGISIKILTGDNEFVTKKVCEELSIPVTGVVLGHDMLHVSDEALIPMVLGANIFARLSPDQKSRIITALRKSRFVVGYLGDGINDAISLRAADIGISVDTAVDVAKESADIILVSKSLQVLRDGILEGRKTFANTMKYIFMGTGSNFGNMFSMSIASLLLPFLPMLPTQILINNLIYDISQLSLAADKVDEEDLARPQHWDIGFIKRFVLIFGPISSLFDVLTFVILFTFFNATIPMFRTGWFVESIITQSLIIFAVRTKRVPFFTSRASPLLFVTAGGVIAISILLSQTTLGTPFGFTALPTTFWIFVAIVVVLYIGVVELAKILFYKMTP